MSPSPRNSDALDDLAEYERGWYRLSKLVVEGFSWSGHERHCCFLNTGGARFANVSFATGFDLQDDGRGLALVDWDHDGDLDCWINNRTGPQIRLLRNDSPHENHYLSLQLVGTRCNRDAIGARVTLETAGPNGQRIVKTVRAGSGFLSQSSRILHFGLGPARRIVRLTVRWPDGTAEEIPIPELNARYKVVQGDGAARPLEAARDSLKLRPGDSKRVLPRNVSRSVILGATRLPRSLFCRKVDGTSIPLHVPQGRPMLVTLWSSTCASCLTELRDMAASEDKFQTLGLRIVALTTDVGSGASFEEAAERSSDVLERIGFDFDSAIASEELLSEFDKLQRLSSMRQRPLVLPTSFLIDEDGHLAVIYRGPVEIDQLLADVATVNEGPGMIVTTALPFGGRHHPDSLIARAKILLRAGRVQDALADVDLAIDMQPHVPHYYHTRQSVHRARGDFRLAQADATHADWLAQTPGFNDAVAADPQNPDVYTRRADHRLNGADWRGALSDYEQALRLDELRSTAWSGAAAARLHLEQFARSIEDCNRAIELGGSREARSIRADCYFALGEYNQAVADYEGAQRFDSQVAQCYFERSQARRAAGDAGGADEDYQRAVFIDPTLSESAAATK